MRRCSTSCGSADVLGVVLVAPVLIAMAVLVMYLGRQVDAQAQVRAAAGAAAHAGAAERSPQTAQHRAHSIVAAALAQSDSCETHDVVVDTSQFAPGGWLSVTVACDMTVRGLELISPPQWRLSATVQVGIDRYRELHRP